MVIDNTCENQSVKPAKRMIRYENQPFGIGRDILNTFNFYPCAKHLQPGIDKLVWPRVFVFAQKPIYLIDMQSPFHLVHQEFRNELKQFRIL